jgi:ATP-dependent protease HslVU (ClpYQ) peptidase subunit
LTTIVVVRKNGRIAIGADALVTFGETRLPGAYEANDKIIQVGDSYVGLAGTTAHFEVFRRVLAGMDTPRLHSRHEVFETFLRAHQVLKEQYFLNPKEDEDDPYESSQITALIANPSGIYGVYSYREVFSFERFWAIGSGRSFALGAMYATYRSARSARSIAGLGIDAGNEFDKSSAGPNRIFDFETAQ